MKIKKKNDRHIAFNDGIVYIYTVHNIAEKGDKHKESLVLKYKLRFKYETIGVQRNYEAMQSDVQLSELISVYANRGISSQDIAVISSRQYKIEQVQHIENTAPASSKLALSRLEVDYDLASVP